MSFRCIPIFLAVISTAATVSSRTVESSLCESLENPLLITTVHRRARSNENNDCCFLKQAGDCKPGESELDFNVCISDGEGGCSCCAQHCERDKACAGFTWHEDEPSCEKPRSGRCRLKSDGCKRNQLIKSLGSMWYSKESRSLLSAADVDKCMDAHDLVMRRTTASPSPPRTTSSSDNNHNSECKGPMCKLIRVG